MAGVHSSAESQMCSIKYLSLFSPPDSKISFLSSSNGLLDTELAIHPHHPFIWIDGVGVCVSLGMRQSERKGERELGGERERARAGLSLRPSAIM